ncbi:AcfA family outer membrane beta-barrel protein [Vibrio cholerae]|uniref:AcfA family outer membrane beta-barrel protein n=2 Tax=Vibrio cholerae TaxID=666 RepID=UPI00165D5D42
MKRIILFFLSLISYCAYSNTYIGIEYGYGAVNHDYKVNYIQDGVSLDPDISNGKVSLFGGYQFTEQFSLEFGYSFFKFEDDYSRTIGTISDSGRDYIHEREWDARVNADQFYIAPAFSFYFDGQKKWKANIKTGVTYTQYHSKSMSYDQYEYILNDDIEFMINRHSNERKNNEIGFLIGAGVDYNIYDNLWLGLSISYQIDEFSDSTLAGVSAYYRF